MGGDPICTRCDALREFVDSRRWDELERVGRELLDLPEEKPVTPREGAPSPWTRPSRG